MKNHISLFIRRKVCGICYKSFLFLTFKRLFLTFKQKTPMYSNV